MYGHHECLVLTAQASKGCFEHYQTMYIGKIRNDSALQALSGGKSVQWLNPAVDANRLAGVPVGARLLRQVLIALKQLIGTHGLQGRNRKATELSTKTQLLGLRYLCLLGMALQ